MTLETECIVIKQSVELIYLLANWRFGKVLPIFNLMIKTFDDKASKQASWFRLLLLRPETNGKNGDRTHVSNYRPISLTSVLCKTMEHVIYSHVISYLSAITLFVLTNMD